MATCDEFVANQARCFVTRLLILPEPQDQQVILCNIDQKLLARESKWVGNSLDDLGLFWSSSQLTHIINIAG